MPRIMDTDQLGLLIRDERKKRGLTQRELAEMCDVGINFISSVERGKETAEIGKVLHVMDVLGLATIVEERAVWNRVSRYIELDSGARSHGSSESSTP